VIILIFVAVFIGVNVCLAGINNKDNGREYRVEMNRLQNEIQQNTNDVDLKNIELSKYSYIKDITVLDYNGDKPEFFEGNGSDYTIKYLKGNYYRFDYQLGNTEQSDRIQLFINIVLLVMSLTVIGIVGYVYLKLIRPFHQIKDVPYELSKGNLTVGLKENKNRFFGRFIWGLDLLRENLEQRKEKELSLQKDKKTLVLSISHDIKTPLSAIKLYAKAISKNLYENEERCTQIADSIGAKADEIEAFISEIIKASSEDFLNLEVQKEDYYLQELMQRIYTYYTEKLLLLNIDFKMEKYDNCLIRGDMERSVEVLQNLMENAIKYGDGRYISIRISREEDCCLATVTNSGCTLSKNELSYIFDSFWRGSNVGNKNGSGLGLYICRQLMQKMDGDIYADCIGDEMQVTAVFRIT
jgi:signal transduction histidine kinase